MPSRWLVPLPGLRAQGVQLAFVHAAVSRWFDYTSPEHHANEKPYTVSPLVDVPHVGVGVEVATLTEEAERRMGEWLDRGERLRLGAQVVQVGGPQLVVRRSWAELAQWRGEHGWRLVFQTPTTFRTGDRSSPLPTPATILRGLATAWSTWSDAPHDLGDPRRVSKGLWVSALDLRSEQVPVRVSAARGGSAGFTVSGSTGVIELRCATAETAGRVAPLLRLASYTGVGSMTRKGLGVTTVEPLRREGTRAVRRSEADGFAG